VTSAVSKDGTLNVACAVEKAYVKHCAAMLLSVLDQRGSLDVAIHFMHGPDVGRRWREALASMVNREGGRISFMEIPDVWLAGLPIKGVGHKATWYRTFLPRLLPDCDRILYLDADVLALDSLEPLWRTELEGHLVAAVTNVFPPDWIGHARQLGIPSERYFNAGVLILGLERMRELDVTQELLDYGIGHADELVLKDQDALNVVLGPDRLDLHPRWNCMNSVLGFPASMDVFERAEVEEARANPAIRHFEGPGPNKPWHYEFEREMAEIYALYRSRTPWPRFRREGATPRAIARRLRGSSAKP